MSTEFFVDDKFDGDFSNSGQILLISVSEDDRTGPAVVNADGLYVGSEMIGNIENSGTITIEASRRDFAVASAFHLDGPLEGNIQNSGSISVVARARGGAAEAYGIQARDSMTGNVSNSGDLSVPVSMTDATDGPRAIARGVFIEDMRGNFSNTGTITATASGDASADAYGLYFENFDGVIADVGTITATSEGGLAYAIYLDGGSGTLNVETKDDVTGTIRVADHNVNLDNQVGSAVSFFEDASPSTGTFETKVSNGNSAWFVQDEGRADPVYTAVDASEVLTSGDITAYCGSVIGRAGEALKFDSTGQVTRG